MREAERAAHQSQIDWAVSLLTAYKAQLRIIQSGYSAANAMDWMPMQLTANVSQGLARDPELMVYRYEHCQIVPMQLMIVQGRATADNILLQQSVVLLDELRHEADASGLVWLRIKTRLLLALAHHALGDIPSALNLLEQALSLAQPGRYIRVFVDEGEPMLVLLQEAVKSSTSANYIDVLLSAFGGVTSLREEHQTISHPVSSHCTSALIEQLSEREYEVIRLIAAGDSNQEIADRLVISIATVKRHISNIYGKLAVTSRTHALVRARELHLL